MFNLLTGELIIGNNDINYGLQLAYDGWAVIYAGDAQNIPDMFIKAPVLLPPPAAIDAELNGDMQTYEAMYYSQLRGNKITVQMIDSILSGLHNGIKFAILFEAPELSHMGYFAAFMRNMYGINVGDFANPASVDMVSPQDMNLAISLYCNDAMPEFDATMFIATINPSNIQYLMGYQDPYHYPLHKLNSEMPRLQITPEALLNASAYYNNLMLNGVSYQNLNNDGGEIIKLVKDGDK